jgi:hypothetical protein
MAEILLSDGYNKTVVDDADYPELSKYAWRAKKAGSNTYVATTMRAPGGRYKVTVYMHRLIMEPIPPGMEVDHVDGDSFNNHRNNLEIVTKNENVRRSRAYYCKDDQKSSFTGAVDDRSS